MSESIVRAMRNRSGGGAPLGPPEYEVRAFNDNGSYICSETFFAPDLSEAFAAASAWGRGWARVKVFVDGVEQSRPA